MRYISTRGRAAPIGFRAAVLSGLAPDGGLYVPASWPALSPAEIDAIAGRDFCDAAARILALFAGDELSEETLRRFAQHAYAAFDDRAVAPLRHLSGDDYVLELFHGPTLAFKDVAMRLLAQLYDWALDDAPRGKTIIGATSGDTGGAAIAAFSGSSTAEVFMLHPKGRISEVQRRIMTTVDVDNIVNIAVEGSFDDCQRIVKDLFADKAFNARVDLGGVNSINWVRLAIQTVYYFTATAALGEAASFVVPTGNFGDVFAGYVAKRMGLPCRKLGVAVNENDIMRRVINDGVYEPSTVRPTTSPSMDIQVASNFERLLFESVDRDAAMLSALMAQLEVERRMVLPPSLVEKIAADFCADRAEEGEVSAKIKSVKASGGMLVDPHTAVGLVALDKFRLRREIEGPAVVLSTAHPAKFPDAVAEASGEYPALPARYADLMSLRENLIEAPAEAAAIRAIVFAHSKFV
ncbi:MAG: threonine synthase [Parvularculaceae bacterium]